MLRVLKWAFILIFVVVSAWGYFFLEAAGVFIDIPVKSAGVCRQVDGGGVVGVEDLTIDPDTKIAFLAGYDRWAVAKGTPVRGAIWSYSLADAQQVPVDATAAALPQGFRPHGISLFKGIDGKKTLFVINHAAGKHSIELFDVDGTVLTHRRTVTGAALVSPNDIVGVGHDAFYVTNDHAHTSGWRRTAEDFGRLRLTTVQFFDGSTFQTVIDGLGGSNGINVSRDSKSLYVSAASERAVHVYDRDLQSNKVVERAIVAVPGFADNIELLDDGNLLLGLHSKIFSLLSHVQDGNQLSPSHVMLLKADGKGSFIPETVYYNKGDEISAASVGAALGNRLLIGAIFERKFIDCEWNGAS